MRGAFPQVAALTQASKQASQPAKWTSTKRRLNVARGTCPRFCGVLQVNVVEFESFTGPAEPFFDPDEIERGTAGVAFTFQSGIVSEEDTLHRVSLYSGWAIGPFEPFGW